MALDQNDLVQRELLDHGVYEPEVTDFLGTALNSSDVFLDVGANCGYYSLYAAASAGCRVVAFEPDPEMFEALRWNISLNPLLAGLVEPRAEALSCENGSRRFFRAAGSNSGMSGFSERRAVASFDVPIRTLDSLVESGAVPQPTVMKVDVEGHETAVFAGAGRVLDCRSLRAVVFEAAPAPGSRPADDVLVSMFRDRGFAIRQIGISGYVDTENYLALRER
jgi:FkbM family methyltransferase